MSLVARLLAVLRRITIVIVIAIAFLFGVVTTVYLSLRSPEVKVPDVVGKDRFEAEKILAEADLNFRVRATRPSNQANPDTVLFQLPRAGEVVKAGQTVAMDISRVAKAGEAPETVKPPEPENRNENASANVNENRPKRPKNKNENENANANGDTNSNANKTANANRTPNANRPNVNASAGNANANVVPRTDSNQSDERNSNTRPIPNENRRPVVPKPTPTVSNSNRH